MNTYKITNVTNLISKRDYKFNSILDIEYIDNMMNKVIKVKPGDSIYLTVKSLPVSIQKLKIKNLITVAEVSQNELNEAINLKTKKTEKKTESKQRVETVEKQTKKRIKKEFEELNT